jgi:N-acetylneuraminic acid mutarotase
MPLLLLITLLSGCTTAPAAPWSRLPSLPDTEGFAGAFAGVSDNTLLVAGGANFPYAKPWQGGAKVWHDTIYALDHPNDPWRIAGHLPRPVAYGVSVTHAGSIVCVGGGDSQQHRADAFRLSLTSGHLITTPLPSLPKPLANACGALIDNTLYMAGGLDTPDATHASAALYRINLITPKPQWQELAPLPVPRMLATAATFQGALYVAGGTDLSAGPDHNPPRRFLPDAYRYDPVANPWSRIADLPHPVVAAPSPAPTDATGFYLLGHDDGTQTKTPPDQHPGFNNSILHYDAGTDRWTAAGRLPAPRVTTPCVRWLGRWIIPSGEMRPGVRSPEVWSWNPNAAPD